MNKLKEYPHLFANGKFKIKTYTGHEYDLGNGVTLAALKNGVGRFQDVSLIARRISDMTDEELYHFFESYADGKGGIYLDMFNRDELVGTATDTRKASEQMLYLLSIGVYPFDQQAFENGTVIDINEV